MSNLRDVVFKVIAVHNSSLAEVAKIFCQHAAFILVTVLLRVRISGGLSATKSRIYVNGEYENIDFVKK